MVQRVVYNTCYGGFGVHNEVVRWVRHNKKQLLSQYSKEDVTEIAESTLPGEKFSDGSGPRESWSDYITDYRLSRDNELLADIVDGTITEYDGKVNGRHASLQVATVPDSIEWTINEYEGGIEKVEEETRTFS